VERVTIDMGQPRFGAGAVGYRGPLAEDDDATAVIDVDGCIYRGSLVSMGNPHCVLFVDDAAAVDVGRIGPRIEHHPSFPHRVNVEFVTPRGRRNLEFRVWERGSGITFACGTGACAAVAAGVRNGLLDERVTVHLLGGELDIEVRDDRIWMTGEAVEVFSGEFRWPR
jgi:diaminopimelate epimerase